jgi:hypothetical protein
VQGHSSEGDEEPALSLAGSLACLTLITAIVAVCSGAQRFFSFLLLPSCVCVCVCTRHLFKPSLQHRTRYRRDCRLLLRPALVNCPVCASQLSRVRPISAKSCCLTAGICFAVAACLIGVSPFRVCRRTAAEFLTGAIEEVSSSTGVNKSFLGFVVLPIAGNVAEHVTVRSPGPCTRHAC